MNDVVSALKLGRGRSVLVIDGSATVALMVCSLLRSWGFLAESKDATATVYGDELKYDLVIADPAAVDPRLAAIRRSGVRWLALVSAGSARDAADATGWVHKPIEASELQDAVLRCLDGGDEARNGSGIDTAAIAQLWGHASNTGFRLVARAFLDEMERCLAVIARALTEGDLARLQSEAHSAVAASANVGGKSMSGAARSLEDAACQGTIARLPALVGALEATCRRDLPVLRRLIGED